MFLTFHVLRCTVGTSVREHFSVRDSVIICDIVCHKTPLLSNTLYILEYTVVMSVRDYLFHNTISVYYIHILDVVFVCL